MHTQILKITGVHPGRLHKLHEFLEGELNQACLHEDVVANCIVLHKSVTNNHCKCRLLKSEFNPQFNTYTVEVEVPITLPVVDSPKRAEEPALIGNDGIVFISRELVCNIYVALGIYPEEQKLGKKNAITHLWEKDEEDDEDE